MKGKEIRVIRACDKSPPEYGKIAPLGFYEKLDLITVFRHLSEDDVSYNQMNAMHEVNEIITNLKVIK